MNSSHLLPVTTENLHMDCASFMLQIWTHRLAAVSLIPVNGIKDQLFEDDTQESSLNHAGIDLGFFSQSNNYNEIKLTFFVMYNRQQNKFTYI